MRAWLLKGPAPLEREPLALRDVPAPEPGAGEIAVDVSVCGVCRTDLHVIEGELAPHRPAVVPGHQVVGRVAALGAGARRFARGARVGVAWLWRACGVCAYCARGDENLCRAPLFTGWDRDGGYADRVVVPEAFAYALPDSLDDEAAAPLLCAGIIGWRALARSGAKPGQRLGLYGFGSSAHLVLQLARHLGIRVFAATREASHRALARSLGAEWAGELAEKPPEPLDAAILFAPAGELVPTALAALAPGGTLACAGIHMSAIPALDYAAHLFEERTLTSVTANTRADGRALLELAARVPLRPRTTAFPLERAPDALRAVRDGLIAGSAVLRVGS
ncbi:MAG TPA: zinc-dependent alcohol dehydrogenase family protein [Myxococcota bacterium]|nr:zinc-dependent alcohol dehydrogenase family protein [Myxococcota bacterium]